MLKVNEIIKQREQEIIDLRNTKGSIKKAQTKRFKILSDYLRDMTYIDLKDLLDVSEYNKVMQPLIPTKDDLIQKKLI